MAKCEICGKDVSFGIKVSHSHRRSNRTWKPNIRRVKALVNGTPMLAFRQGYKSSIKELVDKIMDIVSVSIFLFSVFTFSSRCDKFCLCHSILHRLE